MKGMKAKVLLALAAASAPAFAVYSPGVYTNADIVSIVIDIIGASGEFIYSNITLIGILLLLGFIVGIFVGIKNKAGI